MSSIVLELQKDLLDKDCDILQALRKAHVIAVKLHLKEFDTWIQNELNGYKLEDENLPDYRQIKGTLKAKNPYRGWIPAVITDKNNQAILNEVPVFEPISALIDIEKKAKDGNFYYSYSPELIMKLCQYANTPKYMEIALFISTINITSLIETVKNCLLEWTIELEGKGILGENMTFNEKEAESAKGISQQINNYYGTVVNGNVSSSQIVSGNNNTANFNEASALNAVQEIKESLEKELLPGEDLDCAMELLEDISQKIEQKKKPNLLKAAFVGLKDFAVSVGADVTAALIFAKMQGLFY
ncbi:ABC transporter substrate-binding protein [Anaerobutyricum hallii]|uniref:AbiTii domain-containing protein n=1 Tax=Anaerobutyricum hallii TaxID=39488 RepID=UPI00242BAEB1|nr:ABC transporter substrate-binding protein [Anaerobutyricum hallii]